MFFTAREIESQVNAFLDSAFEQAASTLGPVQVLVDPGDLQVCKISLHFLDPEPDCGSRVGGKRAGRWRLLRQGVADQLDWAGEQHWERKTGGRCRIPGVWSQSRSR